MIAAFILSRFVRKPKKILKKQSCTSGFFVPDVKVQCNTSVTAVWYWYRRLEECDGETRNRYRDGNFIVEVAVNYV